MATTVTNTVASPTLRGQDCLVTVSLSDSANLANFFLGQKAVIGSSGTQGYISWLDVSGTIHGYLFKVKPVNPSANLSSSTTPGSLAVSDTVAVG